MAGPQNPAAADPGARGGQYVTSPGFAAPGHSTPLSSRTAPDSTVVYSPKGWRWEEAGDDYSLAVSKMASSAIESAVRRMRTTFGQVFYIKGTHDTTPPFSGEAVGDTCRVQDGITLDIVAEWRWTGAAWERMQVDNQQISNLDVGKLTAGSASISELAARKIASDVGRFLELTTNQLTVTGNASFVDLTARHIWTRIVTAQQGEFEEIKAGMLAANSVRADNIQVGALDGQVITGATIQTSKTLGRGIKINDDGLYVYASDGRQSMSVDAWSGDVQIFGRLGRRDTWSQVYFNNIVSRDNNQDVYNGQKYGCGLAFSSLEDEWWDGTISLRKSSAGDPSLVLQGPIRKSTSSASPYITVGEAAIAMYTPSGNGSFSFNSSGVFFTGAGGYMRATGEEFAYGLIGKGVKVWAGKDGYILRASNWTAGGCYVAGGDVVMAWDQSNAIWCNSSGVHQTGTKKFAMPVPGETKKRGGLWLTHSCTESPYDGIEYWETVTLGEDGTARWELPDYVPKIASEKAPWIVLTESGVSGTLTKTGYGTDAAPWYVSLTGTPGASVAVLVKGARKVNVDWDDATDEPILRDYARESMWKPGLAVPGDGPGTGILGGGLYGPAPRPDNYEEKQ